MSHSRNILTSRMALRVGSPHRVRSGLLPTILRVGAVRVPVVSRRCSGAAAAGSVPAVASALRRVAAPAILVFALAAVLHGCAHGGAGATGQLSPGDPGGRPSLAALPDIPRTGDVDTPRVRQALLVAQNAFDSAMPDPPADQSYGSLQTWIDGPVLGWLKQRRLWVVESRYLFGVGRDATKAEQAIGEAVVGLLQEDTALALQRIPVPQELTEEPEIRDMFLEIVAKQTHPLLSAALISFRECSDLAYTGPEETAHFAVFCDARFRRLRDELTAPAPAKKGLEASAVSKSAPRSASQKMR